MEKYVLMLEEDTDDQSLVKETLKDLEMDFPIRFFSNSASMFTFLQQPQKPAVILVDYNALPDTGLNVLRKIKSDQNLKDIPVVILSDSNEPHYRNECYANGASTFIKKPDTLEGTRNKIGTFFKYWFEVAEV